MLPTWTELNEKISEFEKKADNAINQKVQSIQSQHPLLHRTIKAAINSVLPFPFNEIVSNIYDSSSAAGSSDQEAILKIKQYFEVLQSNGEETYSQISSQLTSINNEIFNLRTVNAKESTVQLLKDTLSSKQDTILNEIKNLNNQLNQTHVEIGDISGDVIGVGVTGSGNTIFKATNVFINQVKQQYGLRLIEPNYFEENKRTDENFKQWLEGYEFKLPTIYYGHEHRRDRVLNEIRKRLESQHRLLLLGESGTSKSTLLMETICDYFDIGYKVLYSDGTQAPSNADALMDIIKGLANADNKVLVVVDNVHDSKMAIIFHIVDQLQSFNNIDKIRFLLAARQPEYNTLVTSGIFSEKVKDYKDSILSFREKDLKYELPYFKLNEVIDFINKYKEYTNIKDVKQKAIEILEDEETKGHPIMVKFSVLGDGLKKDVQNRFGRYLTVEEDGHVELNHAKIITAIICSLFHISTLNITDDDLEKLKFDHKTILHYAVELDKAVLYSENGIWKTLHARWALELFSFLFEHYKNDRNECAEIKNDFQESLERIYDNFDDMTVLNVLNTIYNTLAVGKYVPVEIINETVAVPKSFTDEMKCNFYTFVKGYALHELGRCTEDRYSEDRYSEDRYNEAIKSYKDALEIDSKHIYAWNNKGTVLASQGKYDEAIQCFDRALEIDDKNVLVEYNKGNALYYLGVYDDAIQYFDKALEIDSNYVKAWTNKGYALDELGEYDEAMQCYVKALEIDDKNVNAWINKGALLYNLGRYDQALECMNKVLEIDGKNTEAWYNKGLTLDNQCRYEEAIKSYDIALEIDEKHVKSWYARGTVFGNLGVYDEAIKSFDKALEIDSKYAKAWNSKGFALDNLGKYNKAIECYDRALEINDRYVNAYYNRACSKCKIGKITECLDDLKMAISLDESNIELAKKDEDFNSIKDNEEFKILVNRKVQRES